MRGNDLRKAAVDLPKLFAEVALHDIALARLLQQAAVDLQADFLEGFPVALGGGLEVVFCGDDFWV